MEYWSIEKMISGCEVFHKPSLYNISIRDQIVLPPLQHSITPILQYSIGCYFQAEPIYSDPAHRRSRYSGEDGVFQG